jgi:anti-sigma factor RsiW
MNGGSEREEVEKLLPWYVTGRLSDNDMSRVASFLRAHPSVAAELELIRAERDATLRVNEVLGEPPPNMIHRVMAALPRQTTRRGGFLAGFMMIFTAPTVRSVRWAALIAGVIMFVEAAVIAGLLKSGGQTYREAAGPGQSSSGVLALVVFADQATAPSIARVLGDFRAEIVDGPKPGNVYKIRLRAADGSVETRDSLLRRLAERRDVIRSVLPGGE